MQHESRTNPDPERREPADGGERRLPLRVGRFYVLCKLGEGAMGVVLLGHDDELDRRVAIKLWRGVRDDDEHGRMLREAQALARLSDPNVVQIYEAGEHERRVYLAMEYVDGQTMRAWQRDPPRTIREIVERYVQAGKGLVAAHTAGLVHRDFKPDNVLVGRDGRVRVADFGLAHEADERVQTDVDGLRSGGRSGIRHATLPPTGERRGAVVGTPAYMSPEQLRGEPTDARSDQFSFCVALWEALHGERPFQGPTRSALLLAIVDGPWWPDGARRVPRWLRAALARGLSPEPERRWPDMPSLLDALQTEPRRRTWRAALGVGVGLAAAVAGFVGHRQWEHAEAVAACAEAGAVIDATWNPRVEAEVRAAFLATGASFAASSAELVARHVERHVMEWKAAAIRGCHARTIEHTWDAQAADRAGACLGEAQMNLEASISTWRTSEPATLRYAAVVAARLPRLRHCTDPEQLALRPALPADPGLRGQIRAELRALSRVVSFHANGRYAEAVDLGRDVLARVDELGWAPLAIQARAALGPLLAGTGEEDAGERLLEEAVFKAIAIRDENRAAHLCLDLALARSRRGRTTDGLRWVRQAVAHAEAGSPDPELQIGIERTLGKVHNDRNDVREAQAHLQRALAAVEAELGPNHPRVASLLHDLGVVIKTSGDLREAIALYERALKINERELGMNHPEVLLLRANREVTRSQLGEFAAARPQIERTIAQLEQIHGADHMLVTGLRSNLSVLFQMHGEFDAAKATLEQVVRALEPALDRDDPRLVRARTNLGFVELDRRELAPARARFEQVLGSYERDHDVPDTDGRANAQFGLAAVLLAEGRPHDALPLLAAARQVFAARGVRSRVADIDFTEAQALWDIGRTAEARVLAETALAYFAAQGATSQRARVAAWLAKPTSDAQRSSSAAR